ncbi:MAG: class I SAM-dependent methyltransferase [Candidatus Magasanikbacteria bacterium]|nr:class I SAM-dependent methyltransferase [Candidatus Magasanikbacteria bacterium]
MHSLILTTTPSRDYELLDSGEGEKLERYGVVVVSRPDPQALWHKKLASAEWKSAHAKFSRTPARAEWKIDAHIPARWNIELAGLQFWIKPTAFKHVGIFPEQISNWRWMQECVKKSSRPVNILNLFGYTGGATLAAARAGASVCHVDGSKVAVTWARDNAELSGLKDNPIRWIVDDVRAFVKREIKRSVRYDGIVLDPPAFGHGPERELWKIEDDLLSLLALCKNVLSDKPLFFLVNGYASGYSAITYGNNSKEALHLDSGVFEIGELTIAESKSGRLLPCGIFARWRAR